MTSFRNEDISKCAHQMLHNNHVFDEIGVDSQLSIGAKLVKNGCGSTNLMSMFWWTKF